VGKHRLWGFFCASSGSGSTWKRTAEFERLGSLQEMGLKQTLSSRKDRPKWKGGCMEPSKPET
jgi:hypothetical protein